MIRGPEGHVQRASFSRYFVRLNHVDDKEMLLDDKHIRRDRKVFTKMNLRAFLKHSLQREAWIGAPWLVKEHLAIQYRLPMEIPSHLLQDARLLANKVHTAPHPQSLLSTHSLDLTNSVQQQMLQAKKPRNSRTKNFSDDDYKRARAEELAQIHMQQQVCTQANCP